ncbi:lytic polysaccharide monooxygenase [Streptomyces sp. NPDC051207]|uniref:lytic polysaccharide monooxygenase n=1 Tax=Streptomyces sp. NPDC051207 TaxID=3154641 RepID=UPI0034156FAF
MPVHRTPARRGVAAVAAAGVVPLALTGLSAAPAVAHGSMGDPVSRVSQCFAEGPENPRSAACRAAVETGGTQALYDWNGVRIGNAAGKHREVIPDGKLCSAGDQAFRGLDLVRADWPATGVSSGSYTFRYRVTAPHKGAFTVYITKPGYDPAKPLAWSDLDLEHPVATAADPAAAGGFSTFSGTLPERSGKHLLYAIWQRSDSPEAFYSCSDVAFDGSGSGGDGSGGSTGSGSGASPSPTPAASAPSDGKTAAGTGGSTVENHGHGDDAPATSAEPVAADDSAPNPPKAAGAGQSLAETGGDSGTPYLTVGGFAALALGSAVLFASVRRRASAGGRHGR